MTDSRNQAAAGPSPDSARWKRAALTAVKWGLFAVVVFFVGRALVEQIGAVDWDEVSVNVPLAVLAMAGAGAAKGIAFVPYGWLLSRLGKRPAWPAMMASVWTARAGRYVPGKIGAVVGVVWLLRRHGVPVKSAVSAVLLGDGLTVIVGALIAVPVVLWEPIRTQVPLAWLVCMALMAVGLTCLHPRVFGATANWMLRRLGREPLAAVPRVRDYALPALALAGQYVLFGSAFWLMARSLVPVDASALPAFVSAATAVALGGFLAFFAPAGLGVQEGLLLVLFGPVIGGGVAAVLAVIMRLAQTLAELGLALVGYLMYLRGKPPEERPPA